MRFLSSLFSRRASARKRTSGEQKRMLISITGLLFLAYLPVSNGVFDEKQGAAFCSGNTCYTVHLNKAKFSEAHNNCTNRGGHLVTLKTGKEAERLHSFLLELTKKPPFSKSLNLWIGLKLNKCVIQIDPLKGFVWTTGDENAAKSQFSNWMSDPKSTCTKEMCVSMKLHPNPADNFKWVDSLCSALIDGYICKFDFQGMCQPLVLAGPGIVNYETPFSFKSASLNLLPHGSFGYVSCGHQEDGNVHYLLCKDMKESGTTVYQWVDPRSNKQHGALCVSEEHGCNYNNGGCQHKCTKNSNGSISCECNDGYELKPDLVSCVLLEHCKSHQCEHKCINHQHGYECACRSGFELAENKRNCLDVDECLKGPCNHTCINTEGSFQCRCPAGFTVHGTQCLDIDECVNSPCSQGCLNTYGSYLCSCNSGYVLDSNKKSCMDVDECLSSPCAYSCENIPGSYTCTCPKGLKLSSDQISCIPELQNPNIRPTDHGIKDPGLQNRGTTSNGQRHMTNQPTPSSEFKATFTEKDDKRQMMVSTPASSDDNGYPSNSSTNQVVSDHQEGYSIVLLVSILCACGVVLILLIVAGGFLCYRKRNAKKKETEKKSNATDKYCWVPESENKANNDYR